MYLHDDGEWNPHRHSPGDTDESDEDSGLKDGRNKERRERKETEQEHRARPNIAQEEGHHWEAERATLTSGFNAPFSDKLAEVVEFFVLCFVLIARQDASITSGKVREKGSGDDTDCDPFEQMPSRRKKMVVPRL